MSNGVGFTDSIDQNKDLLTELISGMPPGARNRAKRAAVAIENAFTRLQKDYPSDPAVAIGAAFAVHILAQRMVEAEKQTDKPTMIQLLS